MGGAQRAGEERGDWAVGDGRREGRTPAAGTEAAAARPGPAGRSARRARGPRSPAQPCECHRRFGGPRARRGSDAVVRVPSCRSRICCPGCGPVPHRPIPRTRAARYFSSPPPGRGGRPQKPPPLGLTRAALPSSLPRQGPGGPCPGAFGWAGPEGGPKAPAWALAGALSRSPRCPRRVRGVERMSWEWGGGDEGCRLALEMS